MKKRFCILLFAVFALSSLIQSNLRIVEGATRKLEARQKGKCHTFCNEQHGRPRFSRSLGERVTAYSFDA
jgi:hypothetical protein